MLWGEQIKTMCYIELQNRGAPHAHEHLVVDDTDDGASFQECKTFLIPDPPNYVIFQSSILTKSRCFCEEGEIS